MSRAIAARPWAGVDQAMWQAKKFLKNNHIHFQPGVNEDLAATAVWGTQQLDLFGDSNYDGVFALWYAKGPGVDRSGDVLRHGNLAGTAKYGGVLLLAGDDHTCKSSTTAHQSEYAFMDAGIPGAEPVGRAGIPRSRPLWLGDVALFRLLGRLQGRGRDRRQHGLRATSTRIASRSRSPRISRCRRRVSTSAGRNPPSPPPRRWSRRCGCTNTSSMRRWPSPAPTS